MNQPLIVLCVLVSGLFFPTPAVQTLTSAKWIKSLSISPNAGVQQAQSDEAERLFQAALTLYRQGKFDEALTNLNKAASLNPGDFRLPALSGYVYFAQRKLKSASEALAAAISLRPQQKDLYLMKAEADRRRNAHAEAVAACQKAIEIDPNYAEAYSMLGELLMFNEKRRPEAIAALQSAIKLNPKLPQPYDNLGGILESAKDEKGAEEVFRKGMVADPNHMAGRFALGRMLVKQGQLSEARKLWDGRTSDEDRTFPQFIELLKRAEKLKLATAALAKNPKDPDALIDMGLAVMEGESWVVDGRQERAIVYFKQALELKPDSARAQYAICKAYIQIADTFSKEKQALDEEMAKLRKLDQKLANELDEYRKTYHGALRGSSIKTDQ